MVATQNQGNTRIQRRGREFPDQNKASPVVSGGVMISLRTAWRRAVFSLIGLLIILGGCATAEGPPGKSQIQLDYENNICSARASRAYRFTDVNVAYAECMLNFGNTVHLSDGRTFEPQYAYVPPSYYQPPQYIPPPAYAPPQTFQSAPEPESEPPTPSFTPDRSSPQVAAGPGSLTSEQKNVMNVLEQEAAKAAISCAFHSALLRYAGQNGHAFRCIVVHTVEGAYNRMSMADVKSAICSNPDSLQRIPLITPEVETEITIFVGCEQA